MLWCISCMACSLLRSASASVWSACTLSSVSLLAAWHAVQHAAAHLQVCMGLAGVCDVCLTLLGHLICKVSLSL